MSHQFAESREEIEVRALFDQLGYVVSRIPARDDVPSADYHVRCSDDAALVEVKGRGPDQAFAQQLADGSRATSQQALARMNTVSRQIREARRQLVATESLHPSLCRIVALVAAGDDPDVQIDQFQKTLSGTVDLLTDVDGAAVSLPCFYFDFSDFFRFRELDGALVLSPGRARLCVNEFGHRVDQVRRSRLYEVLADSDAVTDPTVFEARGDAYIADTDIDRRSEAGVLAYVRNKYGQAGLETFRPKKIRVAVKIPYESIERNSESSGPSA